jgi:hypothetical protein
LATTSRSVSAATTAATRAPSRCTSSATSADLARRGGAACGPTTTLPARSRHSRVT